MYCGSCGHQVTAGVRFCENCGSAMAPQGGDVAQSPAAVRDEGPSSSRTAVVPPLRDGDTHSQERLFPAIDWMRVVRGNWLGALIVAFVTAATSGLMGMALALLAKPEDFGVGNTLTLATILATGAFGADVTAEFEASGLVEVTGEASMAVFPFTITLIALVIAVALFRRITRSYTSGVDALTDAVRAALIFGCFLLLPALLFTSDNDELGRGWGRDLSEGALGLEAQVGADAAGAFFLGVLVLLVVLASSVIMRGDWWASDPVSRWCAQLNGWVRAPLAGIATTLLLLPAAGLIGLLSMVVFGEDTDVDVSGDETRLIVAACIALLANGGVWVISLGTGSRMGYDSRADGEGRDQDWERLWGQITQDEPGLWVSPIVALLVLGLSALAVVRRSRRDNALRSLALWLTSLVVVVPLLSRVTSLHLAAMAQEGRRDFEAEMYAGPDGFQTTVLVLLVAGALALVVALVTGVLSPSTLRDQSRRVGQAMQRPQPQAPSRTADSRGTEGRAAAPSPSPDHASSRE